MEVAREEVRIAWEQRGLVPLLQKDRCFMSKQCSNCKSWEKKEYPLRRDKGAKPMDTIEYGWCLKKEETKYENEYCNNYEPNTQNQKQ